MSFSQHFVKEDNFSSEHEGGSFIGSQAGDDPQDESNKRDHLDDKNEEDDVSVDGQGDDMDVVPFILYQGLPAHLLLERILTDSSSRSRGILVVPPSSPRDSMSGISDPRCCEATAEVLEAFMGSPPGEDHNYIKLKEVSITLAKRVFHAKNVRLLRQKKAFVQQTPPLPNYCGIMM